MQRHKANHSSTTPRYIPALSWFSTTAIAWLGMIWLLAIGEVCYNKIARGSEISWLPAIGIACLNATIGWLLLAPWIIALLLPTWAFSPRFARILVLCLIFLHLVARLLLMTYFSTTLVPLGADLYGYSWKDIRQTVGAAGGVPWQSVLILTAVILLQWIFLHITQKKLKTPWLVTPIIALLGIIALATGWSGIDTGRSQFTRDLLTDKFNFFINRSWEHFFHSNEDADIYADSYIPDEDTATPGIISRHYIDEASYPFLYKDSAKDILSPFFTHSETPPDIVLLIVEGLGRAFTNNQAYLGSFTPFLDSLSRKSLYWENFLSAGGRTFAVLPSILGSLPFGKNGFLELGNDMPPHFSLVNLLQPNGYHSSFYYGGDAHFDNMAPFLRLTGIDELNDGSTFPPGYIKIPSINGFTWGYNDHELFRRWLDTRPDDHSAPQLSIILTVSTHSPFLLNDPQEYAQRFESRMTQLGFTGDEKKDHRNYKDQYASILYTDQAIRDFFTAYAKRKDFDRTIFFITGDHRMPEIPMRDKIDRFHVPLIVYSPLLTRHAQFASVSSHFDITPSLLAWLQHAYGWQFPGEVAWMGDGLDTARTFRNIHSYPLMQTKTDLVDYIKGDNHLNNGSLFHLNPSLSEDISEDKDAQQRLLSIMDTWRQRNERWFQTKRLLPDSLSRRIGK